MASLILAVVFAFNGGDNGAPRMAMPVVLNSPRGNDGVAQPHSPSPPPVAVDKPSPPPPTMVKGEA